MNFIVLPAWNLSQHYAAVLNIIATAAAISMRVFFPDAIYLCLCFIKVIVRVCTFHDGCKQGIDQQIFNRKSISLSPENCNQSLQVKSWKAEVTAEKKQTQDYNQNFVTQAHKS